MSHSAALQTATVCLLILVVFATVSEPAPGLPQDNQTVRPIRGLDGEIYPAYKPTVIERVQRALQDRGLYQGPVNGILDKPTMQAIYEFQKANGILQRSGIPTPRTRMLLHQGSHTDLF